MVIKLIINEFTHLPEIEDETDLIPLERGKATINFDVLGSVGTLEKFITIFGRKKHSIVCCGGLKDNPAKLSELFLFPIRYLSGFAPLRITH